MASHTSLPGETVRWTGSISHLHYLGRWLLALVLLGLLVASFLVVPLTEFEYVWILRGALLLGFLGIALWVHFDRIQRRYTVTDHRVIVEYGLISRRSNEIRLQDVRSINLTRSGVLGLCGVGRVEFSSAATDDAEVVFWNVPNADGIRDLVRTLQSPGGSVE